MIYYNPSVCEHCPNNPAVNPNASGICCCAAPYMSTSAGTPGYSKTIIFDTATSSIPKQTCSYMTTSNYQYTTTTNHT